MSILHMGRRQDSADLAGAVSEIAAVGGPQNGRVRSWWPAVPLRGRSS
jgi:hypothetical protein